LQKATLGSSLAQVASVTDKVAVQNVKNVRLCADFHRLLRLLHLNAFAANGPKRVMYNNVCYLLVEGALKEGYEIPFLQCSFLQCFDAVGWAAGRASGL